MPLYQVSITFCSQKITTPEKPIFFPIARRPPLHTSKPLRGPTITGQPFNNANNKTPNNTNLLLHPLP